MRTRSSFWAARGVPVDVTKTQARWDEPTDFHIVGSDAAGVVYAVGEQVKNVYTRCCGYHESLAVDSNGLAQIAFYSNADPDAATVYEALGGDLTPGTPVLLKPVAVVKRERAWQRIQELTARIRDRRPDPRKSNKEEEEEIADSIKEFRRKNRKHA